MKCPRCKGETRVKDSRVCEGDETIVIRRRECETCGGRFTTFESTIDIRSIRARYRRAAEKARARRRAAGEPALGACHRKKAEYAKRARLSRKALAYAIESGVSIDVIRSQMGLD